jgi:hypothetical protein
MRSESETRIARRAAQRLAGEIDPTLPDLVEHELAKDPLEQSHKRPLDPISLGGLIVSLAALGWTIYRDLKNDRKAAQKSVAAKRVAGQLGEEAKANGWLAKFNEQQQSLIINGIAQATVEEP